MQVTHLYRYPVKGLSAESLETVDLKPGFALPFDRHFAITHANSQFNHRTGDWMPRRNFLVVAHSPSLASIDAVVDEHTRILTLQHRGLELLRVSLANTDINDKLNSALQEIETLLQTGPYQFVEAGAMQFTDSPTATISIMNLNSMRELERSIGSPLDSRRFRGNVWLDGVAAWDEQSWVGKELMLGHVKVRVTETIDRCAAIDAEPGLGKRNLAVLKHLNARFQQNQFGVLAEVITGGRLKLRASLILPQ